MKQKTWTSFTGIAAAALAGLSFILAGCSTPSATGTAASTGSAQSPAAAAQTGAQLWGQTCGHCHNIRSPGTYSDAQWGVTMLHMRVRGNLTAEEHKLILAFMKSAH